MSVRGGQTPRIRPGSGTTVVYRDFGKVIQILKILFLSYLI